MTVSREETKGRSTIGRILRTVFWALVFAFAIGFLIGTLLRREIERPVRYIGDIGDIGGIEEIGRERSAGEEPDARLSWEAPVSRRAAGKARKRSCS